MRDHIVIVDSTTDISRLEASSRVFERIALSSPGDWLPLYYQAYSLLRAAQLSPSSDSLKARNMIVIIEGVFRKMDSIPVLKNELFILKVFKSGIKARVESNSILYKEYLRMAAAGVDVLRITDSLNIRSIFVQAYVLELNNTKQALRLLTKAISNPNSFNSLDNEFYPHWGRVVAKQLKLQIEKKVSLKMSSSIEICFLAQGDEKDPLMKNIAMGPMPTPNNLEECIAAFKTEDIKAIVCLVTDEELRQLGLDSLIGIYKNNGFEVLHFPIRDMQVPDEKGLHLTIQWIAETARTKKVYIHCKAGLGRSGLVSGCLLVNFGYSGNDAIDAVRRARSSEAIETLEQQNFVRSYVK